MTTTRNAVQLIVAATLVAACNSSQRDPHAEAMTEARRIAKQGPFVSVTVGDLAREYADNPIAADGRYKGRGMEVSGRISTITTDRDGLPQVWIGTDSEPDLVACSGVKADELAMRHKGDSVVLQGAFAGKVGGVPALVFCRVW